MSPVRQSCVKAYSNPETFFPLLAFLTYLVLTFAPGWILEWMVFLGVVITTGVAFVVHDLRKHFGAP